MEISVHGKKVFIFKQVPGESMGSWRNPRWEQASYTYFFVLESACPGLTPLDTKVKYSAMLSETCRPGIIVC